MIDVIEQVRDALTACCRCLNYEYYPADLDDADAFVQALSARGVVVLAKADYDALVRVNRDTDTDELRPTLAPEDFDDG